MMLVAVLMALLGSGCQSARTQKATDQKLERRLIEEVVNESSAEWMRIDGVAAVAQTEKNGVPVILVLATRPAGDLKPSLPDSVGGYPVVIETIDPIQSR